MDMYHDPILAEHEALRLSAKHQKPIAVVWHTQVYQHVLMDLSAAEVCMQSGFGIVSQSFVCDSPYVFSWADYKRQNLTKE